jgi:hypothetical protein
MRRFNISAVPASADRLLQVNQPRLHRHSLLPVNIAVCRGALWQVGRNQAKMVRPAGAHSAPSPTPIRLNTRNRQPQCPCRFAAHLASSNSASAPRRTDVSLCVPTRNAASECDCVWPATQVRRTQSPQPDHSARGRAGHQHRGPGVAMNRLERLLPNGNAVHLARGLPVSAV